MLKSFYLLALFLLTFLPSSFQIDELPWQVSTAMADREIRYHHFLWHNIRNLWTRLNSSTQAQIRSYGWAPPRPAIAANGSSIPDNDSGEDFLYFHRQMIKTVNLLLEEYNASNITGMDPIPTPDNETYTLQPNYTAPTRQLTKLVYYYKSPSWYRYLLAQEKKMKDPEYLRSVTLGQFGSYIEFASGVHQGLHFRYSQRNALMRGPTSQVLPYIDPKYDVNTSDWLGDLYCSHVGPWFWAIHGWIDNRINDWAEANNVSNITWNGTWLGGNLSDLPSDLDIPTDSDDRFLAELSDDMKGMDMSSPSMKLEVMEKVASILIGTGLNCDFFNELGSTPEVPDMPELPDWTDDGCDDHS